MKVNYNKQELKALKDTYFTARALFETIRDTAEEIQKNILAKHPFFEEAEKTAVFESKGRGNKDTRILNPFDSYLMSEADFNKYLDLCYAEYKAEKLLVEYAINIIPDNMTEKETLKNAVKMTKYRDKVLDLVLQLEC